MVELANRKSGGGNNNDNNSTVDDEYSTDLIGAIDEGTSSTRFLVFSCKTFQLITYHHINLKTIRPRSGWIEMDPIEMLTATKECMQRTCEKLTDLQFDINRIKAVGITNQRETTVVWDRRNGRPLYNAIVWCDNRTEELSEELSRKAGGKGAFQKRCGLFIHPYFSALKLRWLMDSVPEIKQAAAHGYLMAGTVDSWLIWNLTGGTNNGAYVTDVTNASRTMLMNINTLTWDKKLLKFFGLSDTYLPEIKSSSEIYGKIRLDAGEGDRPLQGVPISGCLGDQQAALVGEACFDEQMCKNTYGSGCFILSNTGKRPVFSKHGLLTTVAYKFGPDGAAYYALEGSIAVAGICFQWLRDNLSLFKDFDECETLMRSVKSSHDVYFVPAFSGLYAPFWHPQARGLIIGLTTYTHKAHLIYAAYEAVCFQTRDILEAMCKDNGGVPLQRIQLLADGGMTKNDGLMQMQADTLGATVRRAQLSETTSLGAAIAAGMADGVDAWTLKHVTDHPPAMDDFAPKLNAYERDARHARWKKAVRRSKNWTHGDGPPSVWSDLSPIVIPCAAFVAGIFAVVAFERLIMRSS